MLDISGSLSISRTADGTLTLAVGGSCSGSFAGSTGCMNSNCSGTACNDAALTVTVSSTQVFELKGNATFTIDPVNGFQMQSFSIDDVGVLGFDICTVVPGGCPSQSSTPSALPIASLASPINNATVVAGSLTSLEFTLTDPTGGTFGSNPFAAGAPVLVDLAGQPLSNLTFGSPTAVSGLANTYTMTVSGFPGSCPSGASSCVVTVEFLPGAFQDSDGNKNLGSIQQFFLVTGSTVTPAPIAQIANPAPGEPVASEALNAAGYIDVTYETFGSSPLNIAALETPVSGPSPGSYLAPFTLTGSGLGNIMLQGGSPVLSSAPEEVGSTASTATFRYTFTAASAATSDGLFQAGTVTIAFAANAFGTTDGTMNGAGLQQILTIQDPPMFTSSASVKLGPLTLQGPSFGLEDVGFKGGQLVLTIGIGLGQASLGFDGGSGSQSSSGVTANLTGILGTFQLKVNVLGLLSGNFSVNPGTFTLSVKSLTVNVPNVVNVAANGIKISYDPNGGSTQQLLVVQSASIYFPSLNVSGQICPYNTTTQAPVCATQTGTIGTTPSTTTTPPGCPTGNTCIPGLAVYEDGFVLGAASITLNSSLSLGSILTVNGLTIGVQDFSVMFGGPTCTSSSVCVSGAITIGATGASFLSGEPISGTITPAPGSKTGLALSLTLSFSSSSGGVNAFKFNVGQLTIKLGSFVSLTATNFQLNTSNIGTSAPLASFTSVGATVNIGSLQLTGTASNFAISGNGQFSAGQGFGISLTIGGANGSSFQWPSWMPISIQSIGIQWPDITDHPDNFTLDLSASINSISGLSSLQISGAVNNIQIDPSLLAQGKFPIVGISGFAVTIQGDLFGGQLDAGLVGGILDLDANNNIVQPTDTTTAIAQRIPYFAIEGGFSFAGLAGFTIRFGLSADGPLQAFIDVEVPGGILLDPDTGLTINDFERGD